MKRPRPRTLAQIEDDATDSPCAAGVRVAFLEQNIPPDPPRRLVSALPPVEVPRMEGESALRAARRWLEVCAGCSGAETNR